MLAADIHRQHVEVYGNDMMSRQQVTKWCLTFAYGKDNATDNIVDDDRSRYCTCQGTRSNREMCNFEACGTMCWQIAGHCLLGLVRCVAVGLGNTDVEFILTYTVPCCNLVRGHQEKLSLFY